MAVQRRRVAYADADEHREAERWLRAGIDVALASGDPDGVVGQLLDALGASRGALGEPADQGLIERVRGFQATWQPGRAPRPRGEAPRPWPPGRNDACWCRSPRKYKKCCGPVPPVSDSTGVP